MLVVEQREVLDTMAIDQKNKMKKVLKFIVAYSFVIITFVQLFINFIFIFNKEFYLKYSFYFSNTIGSGLIYIILLNCVVFLLPYCPPSRICGIAQLILAILWLIIQEDNIYNITAQITISTIALIMTFKKLLK